LALNLFDKDAPAQIIQKALEIAVPIHAKQTAKGMKPQPIRALVIGIPNVGKSTLINRIAKHAVAQVADRPGVTRAPQWIKPNERIWLLDTPGILPMNYDLKLTALHLAAIGAIKRDILPLETIAAFLHQYIRSNYPKMLDKYLGFETPKDFHQFMARLSGRFLIKDMNQAIERFYDDFRTGIIGRITLEVVY
jgi:ribosome biogenesis GTPase A